jgi:hypothetical protein
LQALQVHMMCVGKTILSLTEGYMFKPNLS